MSDFLPVFPFLQSCAIFVLVCSLTKRSLRSFQKPLFISVVKWKFLKCHVLTSVRCLQHFTAALSSQCRKETPKKASYLVLDLWGVVPSPWRLGKPDFFSTGEEALAQHAAFIPPFTSELLASAHGLRQLSALSGNIRTAVRNLLSSPLPQTQFTYSLLRGCF